MGARRDPAFSTHRVIQQPNHCCSPAQPLQWEDALKSFKTKLASGEDVFGPLIQRYLTGNMHRWVWGVCGDGGERGVTVGMGVRVG